MTPTRDPRLLKLAAEKYEIAKIQARFVDIFVKDAHDDGWSYREIAKAMGISAAGAHKMVQRELARDGDFMRRLTEALGTEGEG